MVGLAKKKLQITHKICLLWSEEYMNVDAVAERKKGAYARSGSSSYVF